MPSETPINSEILKNWNLLDVKVFNDIFTQELSKVDDIIKDTGTPNIANIINYTVRKFNIEYTNNQSKNLINYDSIKCLNTAS